MYNLKGVPKQVPNQHIFLRKVLASSPALAKLQQHSLIRLLLRECRSLHRSSLTTICFCRNYVTPLRHAAKNKQEQLKTSGENFICSLSFANATIVSVFARGRRCTMPRSFSLSECWLEWNDKFGSYDRITANLKRCSWICSSVDAQCESLESGSCKRC